MFSPVPDYGKGNREAIALGAPDPSTNR